MDKIRVLFLAANPIDKNALRLGQGVRSVSAAIESGTAREAFQVECHLALRPTDLQRLLLKYEPHIVHFSGYGNEDGEIVFEDDQGKSTPIDKRALANVLRLHNRTIRLVFLNAGFSKSQAEAISGVVDYTLGIDKGFGDAAAITFAAAFYGALAFKRSVGFAFESAKLELGLVNIPGADAPRLFVREGVERDEPFLSSVEGKAKKEHVRLGTALSQLSSGAANEDERSLIRRALIDGRVVLEQIEGGAETDAEVMAAVAECTGSTLLIEVSESLYRRIQDQLYPPPLGLPPPLPGLMFVGREDSLADIKKLLNGSESVQQAGSLTVVRGLPGVGKTTLVGVLARDPETARAFPDGVLWTALDQNPELMSKIAQWGRSLGTDDLLRIPGLEEATERLARLLRDKRMLLIVDDIWNVAHALPFVRAAANSRCALLATTRLTSVAAALAELDTARKGDENPYLLPVLTDENALILLRYLAPAVVEAHFEECLELVRDLECLPLALHVAGRLLKEEARMGFDVIDMITGIRTEAKLLDEPAPLDRAEGATIPTVDALFRRSTDRLDSVTRDCFAYLGVFAPKPATFDLEAMKAVWMVDDPKPIVRKLVGYGLLEPVGAGRFQMHALLVQHAGSLLG
jgi:hypothetical protein